MREKLKTVVVVLLTLLVVGFFLSIYIVVEEEIPGNAVIIVTEEDKLYHSIHFDHICVSGKTARTMPLSEAIAKGYKPDEHCQSLGYFRGNSRFLFHHILSKLGLRVNSRWDEKGNWKW
ncbi:MAG: hypothetical protein JW896_09305 [Deltaproteobacteria bacterium]|nr:hypothetical protein [Deltaproteobacteria bacterium]